MVSLTTFLLSASETCFEFGWMTHDDRQGRINVCIPMLDQHVHPAAAAELGVLHHLLIQCAVFGPVQSGKGLCLQTSSRNFKSLVSRSAEHSSLVPLASFLSVRFSEASFRRAQQCPDFRGSEIEDPVDLILPEHLDATLVFPGIGEVALTRHLVDQFCRRANRLSPSAAWKLIAELAQEDWLEVEDHIGDAGVRSNPEGFGSISRVLWCPARKWKLVLAQRPGEPLRAVTMYFARRCQARF